MFKKDFPLSPSSGSLLFTCYDNSIHIKLFTLIRIPPKKSLLSGYSIFSKNNNISKCSLILKAKANQKFIGGAKVIIFL